MELVIYIAGLGVAYLFANVIGVDTWLAGPWLLGAVIGLGAVSKRRTQRREPPARSYLIWIGALPSAAVIALSVVGSMLSSILPAQAQVAFLIMSLVAAAIMLAMIVVPFMRAMLARERGPDTTHGSARFMDEREARNLTQGRGLILGRHRGRFVRYGESAHVLTFASSGSGKGVGSIVPNLLDYTGSVICIDPKGENAAIAARRRREMGQAVFVLDPWGLSGQGGARFNPLAWLTPESPDLAEDAMMLAEALAPDGENTDESHWNEEARALLTGLLLHVALNEAEGDRHLGKLREFLNLGGEDFRALLQHMAASKAAGGLVAAAANRMASKAEKEASSVLSTAQRHTHFLDGGRMRTVLEASDFDLLDLKRRPMTVFLVLPAERLATHGRWLRMVVSLALTAMARVPGRPAEPVLFLLDEFASLGHLKMIESAMGLMRGYGLKLWPILQDLPQLKGRYPSLWQSFIANAGAIQVFGVNDKETADYFSHLLGQTTVDVENVSGEDYSYGKAGRALLMPDEIMRIERGWQLLLLQGAPAAVVEKVRYFDDPAFQGQFDRNPYL